MSERNFRKMLEVKWAEGKFVCVGLDSEYSKIPEPVRITNVGGAITDFNTLIVSATKDVVSAYKINTAFYEAYGKEGWYALHNTVANIHHIAADVPVILDAKRADIGNTNEGY